MNENIKTAIFAAAAVVFGLVAWATSPKPPKADVFKEENQPFFPEFTDPQACRSLAVVEYDASAGEAVGFQVEFRNNRWVIPSHHDYPADAKDQLAKAATAVIGIRKESIRTESANDHAACGVLDPESTAGDTSGRGRRLTLKDASGNVLADLIIGKKTGEEGGRWFVRKPGEKRVYAVRMELSLSTKFSDWIETDLLKIDTYTISEIRIRDYVIDLTIGGLKDDKLEVTKLLKKDFKWSVEGMDAEKDEVDEKVVGDMTGAFGELKISGVRPKPPGLTKELQRDKGIQSNASFADLMQRGFYFTQDGEMVSQAGDLEIRCSDGVVYMLRFGQGFAASGSELSSGEKKDPKDPTKKPAASENRFLMITARFDESAVAGDPLPPEPPSPFKVDTELMTPDERARAEAERKARYDAEFAAWQIQVQEIKKRQGEKGAEGRKRAKALTDRFAGWYYVVGEEAYPKIHVSRSQVLKPKGSKPAGPDLPFPEDGEEGHEDHDH